MTLTIHLPQALYIVLSIAGLVLVIKNHGKPREPYNAWWETLASAFIYLLLIWGGFFK